MTPAPLRLAFALTASLLWMAPASRSQDVPVEGFASAVSRLEGIWTGGYDSEATGRHGTLTFEFGVGATHAIVRLEMVPRATPEAPDPDPIVLALHLIEVDSVTVRGALAPYDDPEWELDLETHFIGTLDGDRIEGTFESLPTTVDTIPSSGQWWAVRQRAVPTDL